jgi:hypothetical protein
MSGEAGALDAMHEWSRRLHAFNLVAVLLPFLGLGLAAALKSGAAPADLTLAYGGRSTWIYPPFLMRAMVAYGVVMVWMSGQLRRRPIWEFENLLWRAPVAYVAASTALMGTLVLAHGQAGEFADEHTGLSGYFVEDAVRVDISDQGKPAFSTENGS